MAPRRVSLALPLLGLWVAAAAASADVSGMSPTPLIIDTDMSTDVDDVVAICMAHELQDRGEAKLLGVVHNTGLLEGIGAVSVLNHFYGHDDVALGAYKGDFDNGSQVLAEGSWQSTGGVAAGDGQGEIKTTAGPFVKNLSRGFSSPVKNYTQVPDSVHVYRQVLSSQPDHSVVVASIGFLTNLADLLRSGPDSVSPLSGPDLVAAKVKKAVVMGGNYPNSSQLFGPVEHEWNFGGGCNWTAPVCPTTANATTYFLSHWPASVPLVFLGFEVGVHILTGQPLTAPGTTCAAVAAEQPPNPCAAAFNDYSGWDAEFWPQRPSWDPAAVLVAVRGAGPYFEEQAGGHNTADPVDGSNAWVADAPASGPGAQSYLRFVNQTSGPGAVGQIIDDLVCARSAFNAAPKHAGRLRR